MGETERGDNRLLQPCDRNEQLQCIFGQRLCMKSVRKQHPYTRADALGESRDKEEYSKTGSFDSYLERRKEDCSKQNAVYLIPMSRISSLPWLVILWRMLFGRTLATSATFFPCCSSKAASILSQKLVTRNTAYAPAKTDLSDNLSSRSAYHRRQSSVSARWLNPEIEKQGVERFTLTTSAPCSRSAFAANLLGSLVTALTLNCREVRGSFSRAFATEPPWMPVAPNTTTVLGWVEVIL